MSFVPHHHRPGNKVSKRDTTLRTDYLKNYQFTMTYTEYREMRKHMDHVKKLAEKCRDSFK